MRNGIVHAMNPRRGMAAVQTENYGFTIIELPKGDEVSLGDRIEWAADTGLGAQSYRNATTGADIRVFVQNHSVPAAQLRQQLLIDN